MTNTTVTINITVTVPTEHLEASPDCIFDLQSLVEKSGISNYVNSIAVAYDHEPI